ncbi:hypothetical protein COLU111180_16390 [Cohnella lubricantis]|uniref:Tissue inhibitor of metalloproteinase n=1 Tax=Cohnella lubricantis TaxID=2163172 RepID=A0A841TAF3_9BACL|nr:hypothetical protein [Cohnella lubricantis]MBB6677046.1 hypothetical protein [Cohnella lubricantis]MBP2119284.1 hypothetical protein [Cohnella lubricantis]
MKRTSLIMLMLLVVLSGIVSLPNGKASACSCVGGDAKERLERASAVFVGQVVDRGGRESFEHGDLREYTFRVEQAWKGVSGSPMTVYSYDNGEAACGYTFKEGETYLVFSYSNEEGDQLQTNLCSGNVPISEAGADLELLGAGIAIDHDTSAPIYGDSKSSSSSLTLMGGAALILVILALIVWRRRSTHRR